MSNSPHPSRAPVGWILAILVFFVVLVSLGSGRGLSSTLLYPLILLGALPLVFLFSFVALYDLARLHSRRGEPWDSVDYLWAIGFFAAHVLGPFVWLVWGRQSRIRELDAAARARREDHERLP